MGSAPSQSQPVPPVSLVLADSDALLREALAELLRQQGYEVTIAPDGLTALEQVRTGRPTYLICDVILPLVTGEQLCRLLRQDPVLRTTRIIALSPLAPIDLAQLPALSADAYVAKASVDQMFRHILDALAQLEDPPRESEARLVFGFEHFHSRPAVTALLSEVHQWEVMLEALGDTVLHLDRAGRILTVAADTLGFFPHGPVYLIGNALLAVWPPACPIPDELVAVLSGAGEPVRVHATLLGAERPLRLSLLPITEHGVCTGFLFIVNAAGGEAHGAAQSTPCAF